MAHSSSRRSLSSLPDELLQLIVKDIRGTRNIKALSLASRRFTPFCQTVLFKVIDLGGVKRDMVAELKQALRILTINPSLIQFIRCVRLVPCGRDCRWLFQDTTFTTIVQLLATSSCPPDTLEITPENYREAFFSDRNLSIKTLIQSSFSTNLTTLVVKRCWNLPLTLFLVSPNLRKVELEDTALLGDNPDDTVFPKPAKKRVRALVHDPEENVWHSRTAPSLVELRCSKSSQTIAALLNPPTSAPQGLVLWSKLRSLSIDVSPTNKSEWANVQTILDLTRESLENLKIMPSSRRLKDGELAIFLAPTLTISHIAPLRKLSLPVIIDGNDPKCASRVDDLSEVLSTLAIPAQLSKMEISCIIRTGAPKTSEQALEAFLSQNWHRLGQELLRLSNGGRLSVLFQPLWTGFLNKTLWEEVRDRLAEKLASIADMPEIALEIEVGLSCL